MYKLALFIISITAAAFAAAVPPYEPLPNSGAASSTSKPRINTTIAADTKPSLQESEGDGFVYSAAVDDSKPASVSGVASSSWEMYSQLQQLQQELQALRGTVEELNHQINIMQKQERERYLDLDMRINEMTGSGDASTRQSSAQSNAEPVDEKALYEKASELRKTGKFSEAIVLLLQLLQQSPEGLYAPYSDYWLGELYLVTNPVDTDAAKKHFINLLANHPDHVKVPDAMYKLGKLYVSKGEKAKAKSTLNELVKRYPDKSAANLAKDLLKTL